MWIVMIILIAILAALSIVTMGILSRVETIEKALDSTRKTVYVLRPQVFENDHRISEVSNQLSEMKEQIVTGQKDINQLVSNQDKISGAVEPMWCEYQKFKNKELVAKKYD